MPEPTTTPRESSRGFLHMDPIPSQYGGDVRIYESSAIDAAIWVAVKCPKDLNQPDGPMIEAHAHISIEHASILRDQLNFLLCHHDGGDYPAPTGAGTA
jgi:hypothetical protein